MKFLNKKEQVFDIQLTPYGKHKLSAGNFKPTYYAFFDDNIAYDRRYFTSASLESQNNIHKRIKQETQFLESQVLFRQASGTVAAGGLLSETVYEQKQNKFTSEGFIGDARLLSEDTNVAPAWKLVSMQSNISSSALEDQKNDFSRFAIFSHRKRLPKNQSLPIQEQPKSTLPEIISIYVLSE